MAIRTYPFPWLPAICLLVAGCSLGGPAAPSAGAGRAGGASSPAKVAGGAAGKGAPLAATRVVSQIGQPTLLTGKVKLLAGAGGVISNNGSSLVSDHGGGVISNNSGGIISDNGGGLVSKTRYALVAAGVAAGAAELALADATIRLYDATGALLVDERGQALTAISRPDGTYALTVVLPKGNVILRVALHDGGVLVGGELSALLARPGAGAAAVQQAIDTATSLGAAYVLGKFVQGDQATFDRLPASEAARLERDIQAATGLLTAVPAYQPSALIDLSEALRAKAPAVDKTLTEIQALLLGQAHGGDGRAATAVAVFAPTGLARDAQGRLLFGEPNFGRLRLLGQDGTIATEADVVRGHVKQNFPGLRDFVREPDGSLDLALPQRVVRLTPDGRVVILAGDDSKRYAPLDVAATATGVQPGRLALGPDGTLYVGERRSTSDEPGPPRVIAIGRDGVARRVPIDDTWTVSGRIHGLATAPDGTLYVLYMDLYAPTPQTGRLYAYHPERGARLIADGFTLVVGMGFLARGADGTLFVAQPDAGRIEAIAPDGARRVILDGGTPGGPRFPSHLLAEADGTLLAADPRAGRIFAYAPGAGWRVVAGTDAAVQTGRDLTNLPLNAPYAAAFDAADRLVIAEEGGRTIKRFDGAAITTLAGAFEGEAADGRPAREVMIGPPHGLAVRGDAIVFSEGETGYIREIAADGSLRTLVGRLPVPGTPYELAAGQRMGPGELTTKGDQLALDAQGRLYWASGSRQILRLAADGQVELVAGAPGAPGASFEPDLASLLNPEVGDGGPATAATLSVPKALAFDARGDLYAADIRNMRVRKVAGPGGPAPTIATFAGAPLVTLLGRLDQIGRPEEGIPAADATLIAPSGLCFDAAGNLYVSELGTVALPLYGTVSGAAITIGDGGIPPTYARIRKIAPDGTITTVAGPGGKFFPDPLADDALVLPTALAMASDGRLAIVDTGANMIRILPAGSF